jgi:cupin fold WbuC family metalloprotein
MKSHRITTSKISQASNKKNYSADAPIFIQFNSTTIQRENISVKDYKKAQLVNGIKVVTKQIIQETLNDALLLERGREPILIHNNFNEAPQRFINCLRTHSYVRPHMHTDAHQWELMSWLSGKIIALFFDQEGTLIHKCEMSENGVRVLEIPPFAFHTFYTVDEGAYLEIRNCAYDPKVDRVYAPWSAEENTENVKVYHNKFFSAQIGDSLTF